MTELWGAPLAHELARGLAGTRVVELSAVEPDLDPAIHHTNMPYAIISDRHTIAIVEGHKVMIDGPQRTNNANRYAADPRQVAGTRNLLKEVAAWGVHAPAEQGGVADTALSIMRFLKQRGRWSVYLAGTSAGMEAYITARGGTARWPAELWVHAAAGGIRLRCDPSDREIASLTELADFATREAELLEARVLWCHAHARLLAKLRPFGDAVRAALARTAPSYRWHLPVDDGNFARDAEPFTMVFTDDTRESAATLRPLGEGVRLTIGGYRKTFTTPAEIAACVEELADALKAWLASDGAKPPLRDMDYYR